MSTQSEKNIDALLRRYIEEHAGQKLPGEREMAALFSLSRPRLRKLLEVLERDGWIERRQGSGTYAAQQHIASPQSVLLLIDASLRLNDDPFFSLLVEQIQRALQATGARCLMRRLSTDDALPLPQEDAIISLGLDAGKRLLESRRPGDRPTLVLLTPDSPLPPGAPLSLIRCDDTGAGEMAARRLAESGFPEIWFVGHAALPASQDRMDGAKRTNIPLRFCEATGLNFAGGQQAARDLPLPPDNQRMGIIAANDWLAVGLHTGLTARGLSPDRFQIIGFDGLEIAAAPAFGIESLAVPIAAIAEDAVAELRRLGRTPPPPGRVLRYSFTWRETL